MQKNPTFFTFHCTVLNFFKIKTLKPSEVEKIEFVTMFVMDFIQYVSDETYIFFKTKINVDRILENSSSVF
jgi:hypothetical protein